jgi:alkaline phosphatase D
VAIDRRLVLKAGTLGLGALALPGAAEALAQGRGFTHDVASGEPGHYKVMLWTRYVPAAGHSARLAYQLAPSADFGRIVSEGEATADPANDWCVKPVAENLEPGTTYYYRFVDARGRHSPVGRTRTLPNRHVPRFKLAVFSCANLPFGWFNAYAHAADRQDIDLVLHLGDYLYEFERGKYPLAGEMLPGRRIDPASEIVHLADYRLRYASYRADPDLRRLHRSFPMVAMWDDHESANDSWHGGAQNHQPDSEGPWAARKRAATKAFREWLPVSDEPWKAYRIGDLAMLFRPETRLTARSQQLAIAAALAGQADPKAALAAFRDGPWQDSARTMLGPEQEAWLAERLRLSAADGVRWQVLAQQVVMGSVSMPPEAAGWIGPNPSDAVKLRTQVGLLASSLGLPINFDTWDGYPAARARLLRSAQEANANLLVLSGDSHNAWAFDLAQGGSPAGVEFGGQSVTSPGHERLSPAASPRVVERATIRRNPQLKWANIERRGYMTVELTPARATGEWLFLETVRQRSTAMASTHRMSVLHGTNRLG